MKTLVIYPGRFQPFHKGHAQVFKWLKNKFGDVYIATSDKVEVPKSPFNFQEKKQMMRLAGVPAGKIKQVLNPYLAREILKDFDPKTTVLIFAVSQKDMEEDPRFSFLTKKGKPGYLQRYDENEDNLQPFGDVQKMKGYVIVAPTFTFDVLGKPATSASELRKQFVSLDNKKQKEFITDLFGKYDADIHKLMKKKIGTMQKTIKQLKEEVTRKELAPMLDSFVSFASDKLGLKSMPSVRYKTGDDDYNSFAAYNPSSNELSISTANRHPMDIFRSVAHELVHHKQNEDGRLGKDIAKEGSTGSDIENEANAEAGKIMRWFAKSNPDMFGKSYVVEDHTVNHISADIRGLGNVTGSVSPTVTSQYVIHNQAHTETMKSNQTSGLWYEDGVNSYWLDKKGSTEYQKKTTKSFKNLRENLNEGINDPGKLKAIFLAGGPGSGKDFVMNKALVGNGLREINSDTAFEFLMKKNNLDPMMPEKERVEREIVRGRAKNITSKKEINSLTGRLGLIVNGTADDLEKIKSVKAELEDLGYDTMMVFVNTSDEVSRQRNFERGQAGVRKVPDGTDEQGKPDGSQNIRKEKWDLAQKNLGAFMNLFGKDNFTVIDNTADTRKVTPEQKEKIEADFNRVRRMTMQFAQAPLKNKRGKDWVQRRARYQGTTEVTPPRTYTKPQKITPIEAPKSITKPSNELMDQARRLGLSYYGFGRFGRKVGGTNKVLYHSVGGRLVKAQAMNEEKKMGNPCWKGFKAYGMKKKNGKEVPNCVPVDETFEKFMQSMGNKPSEREIGTSSLTKIYAEMTPGQYLEEKKKIKVKKKLNQEALTAPEPWGYNFGSSGIGDTFPVTRAGTPLGFGYGAGTSMGLSESIQNWMNSEKTQAKFADKYGDLWEEKLIQAALRLEEAGCGTEQVKMKKSVKKVREGNEGGANMMGMVPVQRKSDEQQLNERGADSKGHYRSTESGAGLTRAGAKHFGVKTAVTTPPSKLKKGSKAAKRRKSFCARMGGMKGPMKDEKGRPTRKAMSLRRWNCEE
jgi:cytidyltransferase-like protein